MEWQCHHIIWLCSPAACTTPYYSIDIDIPCTLNVLWVFEYKRQRYAKEWIFFTVISYFVCEVFFQCVFMLILLLLPLLLLLLLIFLHFLYFFSFILFIFSMHTVNWTDSYTKRSIKKKRHCAQTSAVQKYTIYMYASVAVKLKDETTITTEINFY